MSKKTILFLHMGPGLNAFVERQVFTDQYPQIEFWDQPKIPDHKNALDNLVTKIIKKIDLMYENSDTAIDLVCHSFGGFLGTQALNKSSDKIKSCTFISTGFYFQNAFLNLLKALSISEDTPQELRSEFKERLNNYSDKVTKDKFWEILALILKDPNFMRLYWSDQEKFAQYLDMAQKAPPLDQPTFTNVANAVLEQNLEPTLSPFQGSIKIILGADDPLLDLKAEQAAWRTVFPKAKIEELNEQRHFIHLENNSMFLD